MAYCSQASSQSWAKMEPPTPTKASPVRPDRGLLPVFQVYPGNSKSLQAALVGLNEGDRYSVELKRLRFSGVETGSTLLFSPDCDWPEWGDSPYYTQPEVGYCWGEGPTTFTYTIGTDGEARLTTSTWCLQSPASLRTPANCSMPRSISTCN